MNTSNNSDKNLDHKLTPEKVKSVYNTYYHKKHLENGIKKYSLVQDDPNQINYEKNAGILGLSEEFILSMMRSYCQVVEDNPQEYKKTMENIFEALKSQSVVLITNHETFANIPILVSQIHKYAEIHNMPEIRNQCNVILGPSLMTQAQKKIILSIANAKKTIPDTRNSNIPEIKNELGILQRKFLMHILKEIEQTNTLLKTGEKKYGDIYFLAPTGMRDYLQRNGNCTIQNIVFEEDKELKGSMGLIGAFNKRGAKIVFAGTNTVGLKRPSRVKEKDNNFVPSDGYIALKEVEREEIDILLKSGTVMQELAKLVKDHQGNQVAKVIPRSEVKELWDTHKAPEIDNDEFQNFHFRDSIGKIITRTLFEVMKKTNIYKPMANTAKELLGVLKK